MWVVHSSYKAEGIASSPVSCFYLVQSKTFSLPPFPQFHAAVASRRQWDFVWFWLLVSCLNCNQVHTFTLLSGCYFIVHRAACPWQSSLLTTFRQSLAWCAPALPPFTHLVLHLMMWVLSWLSPEWLAQHWPLYYVLYQGSNESLKSLVIVIFLAKISTCAYWVLPVGWGCSSIIKCLSLNPLQRV